MPDGPAAHEVPVPANLAGSFPGSSGPLPAATRDIVQDTMVCDEIDLRFLTRLHHGLRVERVFPAQQPEVDFHVPTGLASPRPRRRPQCADARARLPALTGLASEEQVGSAARPQPAAQGYHAPLAAVSPAPLWRAASAWSLEQEYHEEDPVYREEYPEDGYHQESPEDETQTIMVPSAALPSQGLTTFMVRNIPLLYTLEMLLEEWPNSGEYDFLYLPFSCLMRRNLSYAFINFASHESGVIFKERWQKKRLARSTARRPLNISYAEVQGLEANLKQLKAKRASRRTKTLRHQTAVFKDGVLVSLAEVFKNLDDSDL